ncbi:ribosome biogenesis GTP-binding protein YsxC [Candidatus Fermentibacterales bacterium]|nr:ribosome biogenesis GTP-binding protein YsxC [Candidatus Fermentibacterales bacterium]
MASHRVEPLTQCRTLSALPSGPIGPEVAFIGRSNVGKSTLLNALLGRDGLARTSKKPGCTRSMNLFLVDGRFVLVDLPGYGYAKTSRAVRSRWSSVLIPGYLRERQALRGSILLVDSRHCSMDSDREMSALLRGTGKPYVIALTKIDKLKRAERRASVDAAGALGPVIPVSGRTGEGLPELWKWITQVVS